MTEPDNFLARWSRRKQAAAESAVPEQAETLPPAQNKDASAGEVGTAAPPPAGSDPVSENPPVDLASLPPIESIGANTDVTAFLRPGVPAELTRAALRRAWSTDPAIRDFVGLVENGWDFNDPQAMAGFGRIDASDVARLLSQAVGDSSAEVTKARQELPKTAEIAPEAGAVPAQDHDSSQTPSDGIEPGQNDVRCNGNDCASQEKS